MFDSIIFDLDGTLWDGTAIVAKARNHAAETHGLPHPGFTREEVGKTLGLPADEVYRRAFPSCPPDLQIKIRKFTQTEIGRLLIEEGGDLYPGVVAGLVTLQARFPLFIVSNCGSGYIERFLASSGLDPLFTDHECYGDSLKSKGDNIADVVRRNGLVSPVYVGDTDGDHRAAIHAGVPYFHVNYGFGKPMSPCPSFDSFADLVAALGAEE